MRSRQTVVADAMAHSQPEGRHDRTLPAKREYPLSFWVPETPPHHPTLTSGSKFADSSPALGVGSSDASGLELALQGKPPLLKTLVRSWTIISPVASGAVALT